MKTPSLSSSSSIAGALRSNNGFPLELITHIHKYSYPYRVKDPPLFAVLLEQNDAHHMPDTIAK